MSLILYNFNLHANFTSHEFSILSAKYVLFPTNSEGEKELKKETK